MAYIDEARVQSVAEEAEQYYRALLKVQPILREALASDPTIGTGRPNRDAENRSDLGVAYRVSSFDDTVVIGFWWAGERPRFVCSGRGLNLLNADRLMQRTIEIGNKPHAKDSDAAYQQFLKVSRNMLAIVPDPEMDRLGRMIRVCHRDDPSARAFSVTEAEARLFAFLMQYKLVSGEVHLYGTHSPCSDCCQAFTRLARMRLLYDNIKSNPTAHGHRQFNEFRHDYEAAGFDRWRIGGLYYGRFYDGKKRTDLSLLGRAVSDHSIGWVKPILPNRRG
jgi:hypothetical protein